MCCVYIYFCICYFYSGSSLSLNSIDKLAAAFGLRPSELLAAGEARKRRSTAGDQLAGLLEGLTKRQQGHIIGAVREMRKLIPRRGR